MTVPLHNLTDTWNDSGTAFTAIKMNVTDTASAAGSRLIDFQRNGLSKLYIDSFDQVIATGSFSHADGTGFITSLGIGVASNARYAFGGTNSPPFLRYDNTAILAQRDGTNAQAFRVYNTYTDSSNYERGVLDWTTTANVLTIDVQVLGSGTQRKISLNHLDDATGAGTATFAATNCPASTLTSPYTWIKVTSSDGSVVYMPAWK